MRYVPFKPTKSQSQNNSDLLNSLFATKQDAVIDANLGITEPSILSISYDRTSVAYGTGNIVYSANSFSTGSGNTNSGESSVVFGQNNISYGNYNYITGQNNSVTGSSIYLLGSKDNIVSGSNISLFNVSGATINGNNSTYISNLTILSSITFVSGGTLTGSLWSSGTGSNSIIKISTNTNVASGLDSIALGAGCFSLGLFSYSEGGQNQSIGAYAHSEGYQTTASGSTSHAQNSGTTAYGAASSAQGYFTTTYGHSSHAQGYYTTALNRSEHAGGYNQTAGNSQYGTIHMNSESWPNQYVKIGGSGGTNFTTFNNTAYYMEAMVFVVDKNTMPADVTTFKQTFLCHNSGNTLTLAGLAAGNTIAYDFGNINNSLFSACTNGPDLFFYFSGGSLSGPGLYTSLKLEYVCI